MISQYINDKVQPVSDGMGQLFIQYLEASPHHTKRKCARFFGYSEATVRAAVERSKDDI